MKILKRAVWTYVFTCRLCKSELEAEAADVKQGYFGANYGGDVPQRRFYVDCAVCGDTHQIHDSIVPPDVQEAAKIRQTLEREKR